METKPLWKPCLLKPGEVHLWHVDLGQVKGSESLLSPGEKERARRFKFPQDAFDYVAWRSWLRQVLSQYAGIRPEGLEFTYSSCGKPALKPEQNPRGLRFNLAHSHEACLLAVTQGREIGCDLEKIRPGRFLLEMELQFFSQKERNWLRSLSREKVLDFSYRAWTLKEAYLKAVGTGLLLALDTFTLIPKGDGRACLESGTDHRSWLCRHFTTGNGYVASLCVEKEAEGLEITIFEGAVGTATIDLGGGYHD